MIDADLPSLDAIHDAVSMLTSIGVTGLCLDENAGFESVLPECASTTTTRALQVRALGSWGETERFYLFNIIGMFLNLSFVAIMAGLYIGLLTLDKLDLQILQRTSTDEDEKKYVKEIMPLVKDRHKLMVTLLLVDTLAYEALPIFLEQLVGAVGSILLSSTLILLFGEIVPAGLFTGPNQLYLAYTMAPMVQFFIWLLSPISTPIAKLLDYLTGEDSGSEEENYNREELSALVRIQHEGRLARTAGVKRRATIKDVLKYQRHEDRQWNDLKSEIMERVNERHNSEENSDDDNASVPAAIEQMTPPLHQAEVDMVEGALSLKTKCAMDVYTPLKHVYAIPHDLTLNKRNISEIFGEGYSRIPVWENHSGVPWEERENDGICGGCLGFLMSRQLMLIDWDDERQVSTLYLQRPTCISPRMNLVDTLRVLQHGGPQMAFVCARPDLANRALKAEKQIPVEAGMLGLITIVDIMESILQDRIYDEEDTRDRDRAIYTIQKWAATKLQSFVRLRRFRRNSSKLLHPRQTAMQAWPESTQIANETTPLLSSDSKEALGASMHETDHPSVDHDIV